MKTTMVESQTESRTEQGGRAKALPKSKRPKECGAAQGFTSLAAGYKAQTGVAMAAPVWWTLSL